jgi:hypothetical protein
MRLLTLERELEGDPKALQVIAEMDEDLRRLEAVIESMKAPPSSGE